VTEDSSADLDPSEEEALSVPTRTLLFGPLGSTDVSSAVVHRLRAAIGLGLLAHGRRLPREADLATEMGITTFALREALATLRRQGLLVTKAGKYGGSFVVHPPDNDELERAELLSLSSPELRDLGDWRQMLASHAAALAAHRASPTNVLTLRTYADRVREARTGPEARRAHGRFHLELASAAQSMRLTRAEFAVHEQIDWLFGLALRSRKERVDSARTLSTVVDALQKQDPVAARAAAESYVATLVKRLAQLRLELIASGELHQVAADGSTLEAEVGSIVSRLVTSLAAVASDVAPAMDDGSSFQELRTRVSLTSLQRLEAFPAFVKGAGIVAEVGAVPDHPYWIQWWLKTGSGPVEDNHHVMDPEREDFYDYQDMPFIAGPRQTQAPGAYGPYVDYGGVDDYILTITSPILGTGGTFFGVSCADIRVADLESWLAPWLASAPESYLINGQGRVIVSNAVSHGIGDVMTRRAGFRAVEFPVFGWRLLTRAKEQRK
jgi:DNA-binding FadR family transcriptional regulator